MRKPGMQGVVMEERRGYDRYRIHRPIEYRCEVGRPADSSVTKNLSEGGALLSTRHALKTGARLIVKIALDGLTFFLRGRVAHVERTGLCSHEAGVEFLDASPEFIRRYYREYEEYRFKNDAIV